MNKLLYKLNTRNHLVRNSPYPLLFSLSLGSFLYSLILTYKYYILYSLIFFIISSLGWLNEIKIESSYEGNHTVKQNEILYLGFLLFILSEVLIFATFFSSFIYNAINPSIEIFNKYPYFGINTINSLSCPLLNTAILYISGLTCTIALSYLSLRTKKEFIYYLLFTIILSFLFTSIQYYEYNNALFTILDGIYSTNFYILTGFHGFHVFIGTFFLIYSLLRVFTNLITLNNSIGIKASSLYWHFVDWVWLLLYLLLYIWGN